MDLKQIAKNTAKTLISYLTYEAVRTVIAQLSETDPPRAFWLQNFSSKEKIQNGDTYLQALFHERPDLAFRILTVREHLAENIADVLPEMLRTGTQQANMDLRRQQLERMTQMDLTTPSTPPEQEPNSEDS